jgi:hypothetical protein
VLVVRNGSWGAAQKKEEERVAPARSREDKLQHHVLSWENDVPLRVWLVGSFPCGIPEMKMFGNDESSSIHASTPRYITALPMIDSASETRLYFTVLYY